MDELFAIDAQARQEVEPERSSRCAFGEKPAVIHHQKDFAALVMCKIEVTPRFFCRKIY
jgi:hypothetical protein